MSEVSAGWRIAERFNICSFVLVLFVKRFVLCNVNIEKKNVFFTDLIVLLFIIGKENYVASVLYKYLFGMFISVKNFINIFLANLSKSHHQRH